MLYFATLFNSAYLSRGMAMYESLLQNCKDFTLYIFAFDEYVYNFFKKKKLSKIVPISLNDFEDDDLLRIKSTRTPGEYCWTCTPSTIYYIFNKFNVNHCFYD